MSLGLVLGSLPDPPTGERIGVLVQSFQVLRSLPPKGKFSRSEGRRSRGRGTDGEPSVGHHEPDPLSNSDERTVPRVSFPDPLFLVDCSSRPFIPRVPLLDKRRVDLSRHRESHRGLRGFPNCSGIFIGRGSSWVTSLGRSVDKGKRAQV